MARATDYLIRYLKGRSGIKENPDYFHPDDPSDQRFQGTGPLGKIKANEANQNYLETRALANFEGARNFADWQRRLAATSIQAFSDDQRKYDLERQRKDELLGEEAVPFGQGLGNLSTNSLGNIIPQGMVFDSPLSQQQYIRANFGPGTTNQVAIEADPNTIAGKIRDQASKGYLKLGDNSVYNPVNREQITGGANITGKFPQKVTTRKINRNVSAPEYGQETIEENYISTDRTTYQPGSSQIIPEPGIISQADIEAARTTPVGFGGGNEVPTNLPNAGLRPNIIPGGYNAFNRQPVTAPVVSPFVPPNIQHPARGKSLGAIQSPEDAMALVMQSLGPQTQEFKSGVKPTTNSATNNYNLSPRGLTPGAERIVGTGEKVGKQLLDLIKIFLSTPSSKDLFNK